MIDNPDNWNGPAFPNPMLARADYGVDSGDRGMTLRDYFAAMAVQGLLAQAEGTAYNSDVALAAEYGYRLADAMLIARKA